MVNRLVSVGDDFTLPAAVKAADANLPDRLSEVSFSATIATGVEEGITGPDHRATTALTRLGPLIVSHRTSDAGLPENSTEAMLDLPEWVEAVEIDARRTLDGQTVLMHDATLDRTTNGTGNVADKTLSELKALTVDGGGTIPTLKEALDSAADCDFSEVLVDIPGDVANNVPHVTAVTGIVAAHAIADKCTIMVRSTQQMEVVRSVNTTLKLGGFGTTVDTVQERIAGALANNAWMLLIDPGNYAANRAVIPIIQAAGLRAGSSTNNDPVTLAQAKADGAELVLTDVSSSLRRFAGYPRVPAPPIQPNAISGLVSWHDASTLTAANGAAIASWPDLSGNSYTLAQATGALQPVYRTSGINGKPAVEFDGVDDLLTTPAFAAPLAQPNTVIAIAQIVTINTSTMDRLVFDGHATGRHALAFSVSGTGGVNQSWKIVSGGTAQGSANRTPLNPHVHAIEFNDTASRHILDEEVITATGVTPGSNSMAGLTLGNRASDGLRPLNVRIAEFIVYDRILTASELTALTKGLRRKYGI